MDALPLELGATGEAIVDLQTRLQDAGHAIGIDRLGTFGDGTFDAVRAFQEQRGLHVDGSCGEQTWAELVEAGYRLGDRNLYLRQPMMRGDDVASLQGHLGALGFDAGRVDGIFGPLAHHAVLSFQINSGLPDDAIFGPGCLAALRRLGERTGGEPIAQVRERERLLQPTHNALRLAIGEDGVASPISAAIIRDLKSRGAECLLTSPGGQSSQAAEANRFGADLFISIAVSATPACELAYFATDRFVSDGGRRAAEIVGAELAPILDGSHDLRGMRIPILRETRMPAVRLLLGPSHTVLANGPRVSEALAASVWRWHHSPWSGLEESGI